METGKQPILFTIFGGTGDLTYRKLLPALYNLMAVKVFPEQVKVLVIGRKSFNNESYIEQIKPWVKKHARLTFSDNVFNQLAEHISYIEMNFTEQEDYQKLFDIYSKYKQAQQLYYYAVAPEFFSVISNHLMACGCLVENHSHQVLIEKPFGHDEASANELHTQMLDVFSDKSIYRIDHYLGKEMIQNIMAIRFKNMLFQQVWNKEAIDYIAITASETVGVEERGGYYDQTGAIKDMVQNHLFQILSIVLMEQPVDDQVETMFKSQTDIINSLVLLDKDNVLDHVVLGQYDAGSVDDENVVAYIDENKVAKDSKTETFAALKVYVDHPLYKGLPIYLQTGKRLDTRSTEVLVVFKSVNNQKPNVLTIRISPDEGVYLTFNAKKPGNSQDVNVVSMDFCQSCVYENRVNTPEAYERLLFAAFNKDKALFTDWSMVQSSWKYIDHLFKVIKEANVPVHRYKAGSFGPLQVSDLLPKSYFHYRTK